MDFKFSKEDELFRQEIADFVEKELPWDWRKEKIDSLAAVFFLQGYLDKNI